MCDPTPYLNDPAICMAWVAEWDNPGWSGSSYIFEDISMLCRNCGRAWVQHAAGNNQCPGESSEAPPTYWKPSGRLYDDVVDARLAKPVGEVRIIDPNTGGQKGQKPQRFSLIPADFLWALATHYGVGAGKYDDRNWELGYKWSLSEDAFSRHWNQWKRGERTDQETGSHHLIAAIWHLIALWWFDTHNKGTNDIGG